MVSILLDQDPPPNPGQFSRYCHIKQWRGLASRYEKRAIIYRADVVLPSVIAWTKSLSDTPQGRDPLRR